MMLINSLLSHATDTYWDEFTSELERLHVSKAVVRLVFGLHTIDGLTSSSKRTWCALSTNGRRLR